MSQHVNAHYKKTNRLNELEIPLPELDLMAMPPVQKSVERYIDTVHPPVSLNRIWGAGNKIDFLVDSHYDEYLLLNQASLSVELVITKKGEPWTPAEAGDVAKVTPVNNLLHSLFDRVQLQCGSNGDVIDITDYAYKAYLETLLNFNFTSKMTYMEACSGWNVDESDRRALWITVGKEARIFLRGNCFMTLIRQIAPSRRVEAGCESLYP